MKIKSFQIINDEMFVNLESTDGKGCAQPIQSLSKAKLPLFTTHDNVEVFEGTEYWWVNITYESYWGVYKGIGGSADPEESNSIKTFSTESAAKEWVLMNKPIFSLKEIADNYIGEKSFDNYLRFTKLAKQKLNQ